MKRLVLCIVLAAAGAVSADSPEDSAVRAASSVIEIINAGGKILNKNHGMDIPQIDDTDADAIKNTVGGTVRDLNRLGQAAQDGNWSSAADSVDSLQRQWHLNGAPPLGDYVRRTGFLYQRWQRQNGGVTLDNASPKQLNALFFAVLQEYAQGGSKQAETAKTLGAAVNIMMRMRQAVLPTDSDADAVAQSILQSNLPPEKKQALLEELHSK